MTCWHYNYFSCSTWQKQMKTVHLNCIVRTPYLIVKKKQNTNLLLLNLFNLIHLFGTVCCTSFFCLSITIIASLFGTLGVLLIFLLLLLLLFNKFLLISRLVRSKIDLTLFPNIFLSHQLETIQYERKENTRRSRETNRTTGATTIEEQRIYRSRSRGGVVRSEENKTRTNQPAGEQPNASDLFHYFVCWLHARGGRMIRPVAAIKFG